MSKNNQNTKDPDWEVPVKIPGVKPEDYSKAIPSANGSAAKDSANPGPTNAGPPDYTLPGHPAHKQTSKS